MKRLAHRTSNRILVILLSTFIINAIAVSPVSAILVSTMVDNAGSPTSEGLANYLSPVTWSAYIDPSVTNWIAFHNAVTPTTHSSLPGKEYVGGAPFVHWIGLVNDYLSLKITNTTTGDFMTKTMDYNDAMGNESGIQSIIFGAADAAPDVHRKKDAFGSNPTWVTYDEAGAFNSFFSSAATYDFYMTYGNTGGGSYSQDHDTIYFLVDTEPVGPDPIPEPSTTLLFSVGLIGLAGVTRKKLKKLL